MKGTKKLKRILAVMTATVTMAGMISTTAMAATTGSTNPSWSGLNRPSSSVAPSEKYPSSSGNNYPWSDPNQSWGYDYPYSPSESHPSVTPSEEKEEVVLEPLQIIEEQTAHEYVRGSGQSVTITSNGLYQKFSHALIDGELLLNENYVVQSGSTVLTIMPEYLETLPVGAHTVTMKYTYGSVDSALNITDNAANVPANTDNGVSAQADNGVSNQAGSSAADQTNGNAANQNANYIPAANNNAAPAAYNAPKTGDTSAILLWSMVVLASGCCCMVLRKRISSR